MFPLTSGSLGYGDVGWAGFLLQLAEHFVRRFLQINQDKGGRGIELGERHGMNKERPFTTKTQRTRRTEL